MRPSSRSSYNETIRESEHSQNSNPNIEPIETVNKESTNSDLNDSVNFFNNDAV